MPRSQTRRGGVVVSQRAYDWHAQYHNRLLGNAGYQAMSLEAGGAYFHLKQLAESIWDDGAITIGSVRRNTKAQIIDYLAKKLREHKDPRERAKAIVKECLDAGLLILNRANVVYIANAVDEQFSQKPDAKRKRAQYEREREAERRRNERGGDGAAPPAPAASTRPGTDSDYDTDHDFDGPGDDRDATRDISRRHHDTSESQSNSRQRDEHLSTSTSKAAGAGGAAGSDQRPPPLAVLSRGDADIYSGPPVDVAVLITGDRQTQSRRYWEKMLLKLGPDLFRTALAEFKAAVAQGVKFHVPPGAYFGGFLRDKEKLLRPSAVTAHP